MGTRAAPTSRKQHPSLAYGASVCVCVCLFDHEAEDGDASVPEEMNRKSHTQVPQGSNACMHSLLSIRQHHSPNSSPRQINKSFVPQCNAIHSSNLILELYRRLDVHPETTSLSPFRYSPLNRSILRLTPSTDELLLSPPTLPLPLPLSFPSPSSPSPISSEKLGRADPTGCSFCNLRISRRSPVHDDRFDSATNALALPRSQPPPEAE